MKEEGGTFYFSRSHADFEGRCCGVGNMGKQGAGEEVWISAGLCQEIKASAHKTQNFFPPSFHEMSFGQTVVEEEEGYVFLLPLRKDVLGEDSPRRTKLLCLCESMLRSKIIWAVTISLWQIP